MSHGAPTIVIDDSPARHFLARLAGELPQRPDAIVLVSAHFDEPVPTITSSAFPDTIHDFGGFPDVLYRMRYPAPGSPGLAQRISAVLEAAGHPARLDPHRGLDHGAWTPLMLAWPDADIPVVSLSVNTYAAPIDHYRLGQALASLRDDNVLILGSGAITHNLRAFFTGGHAKNAAPEPWVREFLGWLDDRLVARDHAAVLSLAEQAPYGRANHPTSEHILPLFVALGAGGDDAVAKKLHASVEHGVLAMDAWRFG